MIHITTPDEAQLEAAAQLSMGTPGHHRGALRGHLRWHARTPYAHVRVFLEGTVVAGVCTAVHLGKSARIAQVWVHPDHRGYGVARSLMQDMCTHLYRAGAFDIHLYCAPEHTAAWRFMGFRPYDRFLRYADGLFLEAQRDEVLLLEPTHTLALLHLDQRATGEDRAPLLLEHHYAAQGYVEQGRLRGGLLPLLGHGLVLADAPAVGLELQRWLLPVQEHIVVPAANEAACAHLQERGYRVQQTTVRMVLGVPPPFRPELVFAWPW